MTFAFPLDPQVVSGDTTDVYFVRTVTVLQKAGINPIVTMEFFPQRDGILCGMKEALALLEQVLPKDKSEVWALEEGTPVARKEVALRIKAPYTLFGIYETALCGILAHCTGWATAARECVEAARGIPVVSFGARHVHPRVAAVMDYSAVVGGCVACSSIAGARLAGVVAAGTMPHAFILCVGDTVRAVELFDQHLPPDVPRIALVDTFKDEVEESLRVARALGARLQGIRLDTPVERGRVTVDLVKEVRAHLDLHGFTQVQIVVSGGLTPDRIRAFVDSKAPVNAFGVGGYITSAPPNDFTADIHEVDGKPIAKRGRIPGLTPNPRLKRVW
ncbi:MAG: nicotinate phosphoribosyltransferase [Dehalococcoidia bacterium]|nr:nicotinate phosphoribosyltransferase [Dehalococcoidia bacterium]MDW8119050.1 nicotinate phosphoribosyltransferase [Chloroflexota bacterium]